MTVVDDETIRCSCACECYTIVDQVDIRCPACEIAAQEKRSPHNRVIHFQTKEGYQAYMASQREKHK